MLTAQDLIDRAEITDVSLRYATGIDRRDWDLYRSIFTDELELDFSSWSGQPAYVTDPDTWVAGVRNTLSGFNATQHVLTNHAITLGEDRQTATCVCYMQALHHLVVDGDRQMHSIGGFYTNSYVKLPDGWRIKRCQLTVTWEMGDRGLFAIAGQRWKDKNAA